MKISIDSKNLQKAIRKVEKATGNSVTGMASQVLVEVAKNDVTLTCYDSSRHLLISTKVEGGSEDGKTLLDVKTLSSLLTKLNGDVTIETNGPKAILRCGRNRLTMDTKNPDEFVVPPAITTNKTVVLSGEKLKQMVGGVLFATSDNDNNPLMRGVNVVVGNQQLVLTALDGHRIAIKSYATDTSETVDMTVNGDMMKTIVSSLEGNITLAFNDNFLIATDGTTKVMLQLISGKYFNTKNFTAAKGEIFVKLNRRELINAMEICLIFVKEGDKKPVIFDLDKDKLNVSLKSSLGETEESFVVENNDKSIKIGFNPKFLIDALKEIDDEEIVLEMTSPKAPMLIRGNDYTYLVLPVNIK